MSLYLMNMGQVAAPRGTKLAVDHPVLLEWAYAREMFRRLGFAAKDLYFVVHSTSPPGMTVIGVVLRHEGREFEWMIGVLECDPDVVAAFYDSDFVPHMNTPNAMSMDAFFASWAFGHRWELMVELGKSGITSIPADMIDSIEKQITQVN